MKALSPPTDAAAGAVVFSSSRVRWVEPVFFLSGFAAILYQVVWQRTLFAIFGSNAESACIVVTAFLAGLGLGSLAGGALSKRSGTNLILTFGCIEALIGVYGSFSISLFHSVGEMTLRLPPVATALVTLLLVLLPTMLMGSTLPVLVAHGVQVTSNVGHSVSQLYFINTLGSAIASFASSLFLLRELGQQRTIWVAAAINVSIAAWVVVSELRRPRR